MGRGSVYGLRWAAKVDECGSLVKPDDHRYTSAILSDRRVNLCNDFIIPRVGYLRYLIEGLSTCHLLYLIGISRRWRRFVLVFARRRRLAI